MNRLLTFKHKPYENAYNKDLEAYTSHVIRSHLLIALIVLPFLPIKQYWNIRKYSNLRDGLRDSLILLFFYLIVLVINLVVRKFRTHCERFTDKLIWTMDMLHAFLSIFLSFVIISESKTHTDPRERYLDGWWTAIICVAFFSTISNWFLRISAYSTLILRSGLSFFVTQNNYSELITTLQIILFLSLKTYYDERRKREFFIEKQELREESQFLKGLQSRVKVGVAACDLKGKVVFNSMSQQIHRWWRSDRSNEQNLSQITITRRKETWDDLTVRLATVS